MLNLLRRPIASVSLASRNRLRRSSRSQKFVTRAAMVKDIQPKEAAATLTDAVYLDVRTAQEFEAERVKGAVNVPFMLRGDAKLVPNAKFTEDAQAALPDKSAKIVVGCQVGGRSSKASAALQQVGYEDVSNILGGLNAWKSEQLPLEKPN